MSLGGSVRQGRRDQRVNEKRSIRFGLALSTRQAQARTERERVLAKFRAR